MTRLARALGCEDYAALHRRLGRGARALLARSRRRPRARPGAALGRRARRLARDRVDDLVRGRAAEHRPGLRARVGGANARRGRGRLPYRGRRPRRVDVRRALRAGREARGGARRARRRRRRPRRDLHADGAGSRRRLARLRPHRGDPGADLLRLRSARRRAAATGLGREGRDHGRLLAAPRRPRADAGDDRGGAARVADRRARRRVVAGRSKLGRRARSGRAAAARGRGGASVSARVHVRDDGAPEGRTARARRLPALDRP